MQKLFGFGRTQAKLAFILYILTSFLPNICSLNDSHGPSLCNLNGHHSPSITNKNELNGPSSGKQNSPLSPSLSLFQFYSWYLISLITITIGQGEHLTPTPNSMSIYFHRGMKGWRYMNERCRVIRVRGQDQEGQKQGLRNWHLTLPMSFCHLWYCLKHLWV